MDEKENLERNLALFGKIFPGDASRVRETPLVHVHFAESVNGLPNLTIEEEGELHFILNKENPIEEAYLWTSSLPLNTIDVVFIYGVGLGYYYDALESWLNSGPNKSIIFIEDNPEILKRFFQTEKATKILANSKVRIYLIENFLKEDKKFNEIALFYCKAPFKISALLYNLRQKSEKLIKLNTVLEYMLNIQKISSFELEHLGYNFFLNFFQNLVKLPESKQASLLYNRFKGMPAIICGAGPSLNKNIHILKKLKDKAIIIAPGTAMNVLNKAGIIPHFGAGIDPNPDQTLRILTNLAFMTPYFYKTRMNATALNLIQGDLLYLNGSYGYKISSWFEEELGLKGVPLEEGYNVVNASFEIANALGCSPLITVGVDLAYSNDESYADLTAKHPLSTNPVPFKTKTETEELLSRMDINGKPVMTLWKWLLESVWYSRWVLEHPQTEFLNATEGGIGFPGVSNIPLEEVSLTYLKKDFDVDGFIHLFIQDAEMEKSVSFKHIDELLQKLEASLNNCQETITRIKKEFETFSKNLGPNETAVNKLTDPNVIQLLGKLENEIGYQVVLDSFNVYFNKAFEKEVQNLTINDDVLGKSEVERRKLEIHSVRYKMLEKLAKDTLVFIKGAKRYLSETAHLIEACESSHENIYENEGKYSSDESKLVIDEPKYHLLIQENYSTPLERLEENFQEKGKHVYFRKNGLLHGASIYYFKNGKEASISYYYNGNKVGRNRTFYKNGSLYSLSFYKEGKKEGKEWYLYPNGGLRAELEYIQGILNGEVKLYYPNGTLKRSLSFKEGLKEGYESLFSPNGVLIIEAEYSRDKPKGTARYYNLNKTVIKEVHFDEEGNPIKTLSELETGELKEVSKDLKEEDYFDSVTKATKALTSALEAVSQRIALFLGTSLEDEDNELNRDIKELREMLAKISSDLTILKKLESELEYESGMSSKAFKEPIWKSPSAKRLLNAQISVLTEDLEKRLMDIEKRIVDLKTKKTT